MLIFHMISIEYWSINYGIFDIALALRRVSSIKFGNVDTPFV